MPVWRRRREFTENSARVSRCCPARRPLQSQTRPCSIRRGAPGGPTGRIERNQPPSSRRCEGERLFHGHVRSQSSAHHGRWAPFYVACMTRVSTWSRNPIMYDRGQQYHRRNESLRPGMLGTASSRPATMADRVDACRPWPGTRTSHDGAMSAVLVHTLLCPSASPTGSLWLLSVQSYNFDAYIKSIWSLLAGIANQCRGRGKRAPVRRGPCRGLQLARLRKPTVAATLHPRPG